MKFLKLLLTLKVVKLKESFPKVIILRTTFGMIKKKNEWVMVLKGSAGLRLENDKEIIKMMPGDYINIPAHCKHRVEWTDPDIETIWLAIHY